MKLKMGRKTGGKNKDYSEKREKIISEMGNYSTMSQWAEATGVSRQAIDIKLTHYDLKKEWMNRKSSKRASEIFFYLENRQGIYTIGFKKCNKKYIGYSKHVKLNVCLTVNALINNEFFNIELQQGFNEYGIDNVVVEHKYYDDLSKQQCLEIIRDAMLLNRDRYYNIFVPLSDRNRVYNRSEELVKKKYGKKPRKKSRYKYVTWAWRCQKWKAQPTINGRQMSLGYFNSDTEARMAIDDYIKNNYVN